MCPREQAAAAAMGLAPPPSSSSSTPKPTAAASTSTSSSAAADPFANYTTAAQLGFKDEAADRARDEAERRKEEGLIGTWEKVVKPARLPPVGAEEGGGKGKGRAGEEGFVGRAVLGRDAAAAAAAAAGGIKREHDELKPEVAAEPPADAPAPASAAGAGEGARDDDVDDATAAPATKKKRGFLTEKAAFADDPDSESEDVASRLAASIKLKKRRLTVREQQAEADAAARAAAERARAEESARSGKERKGAWERVEVGEEPMLEFESEAPAAAAEGGEAEAGAAEGAAPSGEEGQGDKPKPAAGGFKKRKIPGAAARRK